jgi:HK97 family phage major capsid protein
VQTSPAAAVDYATTFDRTVVEGARTPLVIRDLFGAESISGSTLVYLVEGALEGAPAVTAEGNEKPQIHFADPTPKTVSLKKIACHIKESDEYINDYAFLESAINGRLLYELGLVEQNTLVTDLTGTSGIQTGSLAAGATATDIAEGILQGAMDVQAQTGFNADAIVLHPSMWFALRTAKASGTGEYFGGGFFGAQNIPNLWGIPVCVSVAVGAKQIIVGAFKTCASVVQNGGVSVESTNTNEDDFVKNLMTIRAEERLALAVRRPLGFKLITQA